ncbi:MULTISPECIES: SDR family NAD(P)-dependent oxidoreductase [Methylosinus]|uniref:Oxidoreductase n=1 Tax=Methylosinus trichosporium (strain ATCC 35070 / NCIMB 11131 / UNIQEM 75 / OB3b) TaxID=595536 RepID=A0A2D2D304_METT3|nr:MULTISPECIES: SDR family NAD(P)-dependent oxidoreductase [Methylosinus]ATQ69239.1 oxidoreductase [Methylosinus trichosporium OB3b]OBS53275.1 oxidoreductase [Methylosinus sp. 3S-1]
MNALVGRVALVTGASRGIGRAVALQLAREGAHVVALARAQGPLEFLYDEITGFGGEATIVPLDVAEFDNLDRLGACIHERWKKLDILVGNAGLLGPLTPLPHVEPQQWARIMDVNVTANWRLVRAMDMLLRASDAGRCVFVTSGAAWRIKAYWGPYAVSKAAVNALARTYAAETVNTSNVKVMLANPGPLRTDMRAAAMPGEDPQTLRTPEEFAPRLAALCRPDWAETGKLYDFPTDRLIEFED